MNSSTGSFQDHPTKDIIRQQWDAPLLKHLNKALGYKLLYLGLPGPQAIDIMAWIEYLDQVIAFQCRDYPNPSNISQSPKTVEKLGALLDDLERKRKLTSYSLYDGWFEEVLSKGADLGGNLFKQENLVTIYNLDFCNALTVPHTTVDVSGNTVKWYKMDAIKKLLDCQQELNVTNGCSKYILSLTSQALCWEAEVKKLIRHNKSKNLKKYLRSIASLEDQPKSIRMLRAYVVYSLSAEFRKRGFVGEFLPTILYKGSGRKENWLLHFTVLGTSNTDGSSHHKIKDLDSLCKEPFLLADQKGIKELIVGDIGENSLGHEVGKIFNKSYTHNKLWQ